MRAGPAARLVQATSISAADFVLEIGPGRGALTKPLAKRTHRLVAVELDEYFAARLADEYRGRAEVVHADFLDYSLPNEDYVVVGNLPYSRSTEIIRKLVEAPRPPRDVWIVVQRELAYRMCGLPYTRESVWSLRLKPSWHVEVLDRPRRFDFEPPPSVESVFLHLCYRPRSLIDVDDRPRFHRLVEQAFTKNVAVGEALRTMLSKKQIRRLAGDLRFDATIKPNGLTFEQWLGIYRYLQAEHADYRRR